VATPADVTAYRQTQTDLVALALAALARWWEQVAMWSPDALVVGLEAFLPDLVAAYGDAASLAAADWYDELRAQAAPPGRAFRAVMATPASPEQVAAVARWAAGPLFSATPDRATALEHLAGGVQRLVLQPARQTIAASTSQDPAGARWARVPSRADTCAFCRLLASRGAVYESADTAGGSPETSYHSGCGCVPTPVWPGEQEPYDVDVFLEQYNAARAKAGGNPKAILAQMRQDLGTN
jgi:hypothetical protein